MEKPMGRSEVRQNFLRPFRWYVARRPDDKSAIAWREKRRILYNLFLFLFCLAPCLPADLQALGWTISIPALKRVYPADPGMLVFIDVLLQVLSNVWYTGGWLVELIVRAVARGNIPWFGPMALAAGTLFSFAFAAVLSFPGPLVLRHSRDSRGCSSLSRGPRKFITGSHFGHGM